MSLFKSKEEKIMSPKGQMDETPFNIINNSEILTKEDLAVLDPLKGELKETFLKSQVFRTRTEMEVSVLNDIKFPTPQSKYWQSVREQNVMFTELVYLSYEYRKQAVKIKFIERNLQEEMDELKKELLQIELEKKIFMLKDMEKTAKDRIREVKAWSEIKEREAKSMEDTELADVDNHQLISYTHRWIRQAINMPESIGVAEKNNLLGQLRSGLKGCEAKGLLDKVSNGYSKEEQNYISQICGFTKN